MLVFLSLWGCQEPAVVQPASPEPVEGTKAEAPEPLVAEKKSMLFNRLDWDDAFLTNAGPTAVKSVLIDGEKHAIDFHVLARAGEQGFGTVYGLDGEPVEETCNAVDFNALLEARGRLWLTSHFECTPGGIYLSELEQDATDGTLHVLGGRPVDLSAEGGAYNPCAGQITPWGTHLASEEYEPDASQEPTSLEEHGWDYISWSKVKAAAGDVKPNPYQYGWTPEVAIMTPEGDTLAVKHKSMGRFSHEIAYVLPDERTVYLSDDGTGGGLFMFVADKAAELASGTLYAARLEQTEKRGGVITWVSLGHATDSLIDRWIQGGVTFAHLFERAELADGVCPEGFQIVAQDGLTECLRLAAPSELVSNPALAASRLETRRYAALIGATTEFQKGEGITYDPERKVLYVAFAKIGGRMLPEPSLPESRDHLKMEENPCGAVWAGYLGEGEPLDANGQPIASEGVVRTFRSILAGSPQEADEHGNTCSVVGPANPDNISFLPGYDTLMIAEDTKRHAVAALWALETRRATLRRVMVAPPHGEITGLHWIPDLGGHGYLTVAVQHPWELESLDGAKAKLPEGVTANDQRSMAGYLGPFPKLK